MSSIENQPNVKEFPLTRRETLLSALFGGTVGLATILALIAVTS